MADSTVINNSDGFHQERSVSANTTENRLFDEIKRRKA